MELVKKNIVSIVCGVIALLAVVASFYPLGGFFEDLDRKVNESEANHTQIKGLVNQTFTKPIVDPLKTEAPPLEVFPTPPVIEAGKKAVETMASKSSEMLKKAMEMNRRRPLVADALPIFQSGSAQSDFKRLYYAKMDEWVKKINGVVPPQQSELAEAKKDLWTRKYEKQVQVVGGVEQNKIEVEAEFQKEVELLPDVMKKERAEKGSVYVTRRTFGKVTLWDVFDENRGIPMPDKNDFPELGDIWTAQLAIWIQDDVVQAIAETNARFGRKAEGQAMPTVAGSVVKRLTRINIPKRYITKLGETPIVIPKGQIPANMIPPADEPGQFKPFYGPSITGRVGNALYDVMHFTVTVDVEAAQANQFLNVLEANRFFTIRTVDVLAVDREKVFGVGFIYGSEPVVQLTIGVEALFFRDWTLEYMPEGIQKVLGITPKPAGMATTGY